MQKSFVIRPASRPTVDCVLQHTVQHSLDPSAQSSDKWRVKSQHTNWIWRVSADSLSRHKLNKLNWMNGTWILGRAAMGEDGESFRLAPPLFHSIWNNIVSYLPQWDIPFCKNEWKSGGAIRKVIPKIIANIGQRTVQKSPSKIGGVALFRTLTQTYKTQKVQRSDVCVTSMTMV